jgi:long-chain acyl-CoA synthetase
LVAEHGTITSASRGPDQQGAVRADTPAGSSDGSSSTAAARSLIAGYKVPKTIELRSEPLPKSGAGRLLKRDLREPRWAGMATWVAGE